MLRPLFLLLLLNLFFSKSQGKNSPYYFIENKGQWPEEVKYRADIPGGKLYVQKNALTYLFYDSKKVADSHIHGNEYSPDQRSGSFGDDRKIRMHSIEVNFLNAQSISINAESKRKEYFNYIKTNLSANTAYAYEQVFLKNLYSKIDLKLYSSSYNLKYDIIIKPGGDAKDLAIEYKGQDKIWIADGNLNIKTSLTTLIEQKPFAYQVIKRDTVEVKCEFKLNKNIISFFFPNGYDKEEMLVIDPLLIFSTFSGSFSDNWGYTATYGERGTLYSGGNVFEPGFPTTIGAFQESFAGILDVGIIKFDSTGGEKLWATYLGGSALEVPHSLLIDSNNDLIILGTTSSPDFPTSPNGYDRSFGGGSPNSPLGDPAFFYDNGSDLFVTKISGNGTALVGSTFFGGSGDDGTLNYEGTLVRNYGDQFRGDVIVDAENNVYVASNTTSIDMPIVNGFQPDFKGGNHDGLVFKLNSDLSSLVWSSYLGGSTDDAAFSIKLDNSNHIYVAGGTNSDDFPTTPGVLHPGVQGSGDGFVTKIAADGSSILNSSYVGTSNYDQAYFLDIDTDENIYLYGQTQGTYPVSAGVYNNANGGQFIHKMNNKFDSTFFSTVFGASVNGRISPNISPTAFLASSCENIYVSGWGSEVNRSSEYIGGSTSGLPVSPDAIQRTTNGSDFYLMVLSKDAKKLLYATFFGGAEAREHVDGGTSRFDKSGIVYHVVCAGCWGSSAFTTTNNAYSRTNLSDRCNMAAFKFDLSSINASFDLQDKVVCKPPYRVNIVNNTSGAVNYFWDFGDGTTSTSPNVTFHDYDQPGQYTITLQASNTENCGNKTAVYSQNVNISTSNFFVGEGSTICEGESFQLTSSGGEVYQWSPVDGLADPNLPSPVASPSTTTWYKVAITDQNNCVHTDSILVSVIKDVQVEFEYSSNFSCTEPPVFQFTNLTNFAESYFWDFGDGNTSTEESPSHTFPKDSTYQVRLTGINSHCTESKVIALPVRRTFVPNAFTPNNDGKNDYFEVRSQEPLKVVIVNRWGKEVYSSNEYKNDWNAEGYPNGTYFYSLQSKDGRECKGWVQVLK